MKTSLLVDYLTFSIKSVTAEEFGLDFVMGFLGFDTADFVPIGPRMFYQQCYKHRNGIFIYECYGDRAKEMGICVSMSGQGCRYFESHMKDGEMCENSEIWIPFFRSLRDFNNHGYSVNISRIDIAADDKSSDENHLLDLELVDRCANSREFVSRFRHMEDYTSKTIWRGRILGKCLYFGSMKSDVSCRFYDKLAEQKMKYAKDADRLAELDPVTHWVRMEFVFRGKQAIKIVNVMCDSRDFSLHYAKVVNGYVRFVEPDNENVSRCTVKAWWARFIGTLEKASLSTGDFKPYSFERMYQYYLRYLSTTVFSLLSRLSPSEFFEMTRDNAARRLKRKHRLIIDGKENEREYSMAEWWALLNPVPAGERAGIAAA